MDFENDLIKEIVMKCYLTKLKTLDILLAVALQQT